MNARFIDACLAEIDEAVTWYANQRPELPERIPAELQDAMEKLAPFPDSFQMVADPYRRVRLSKFPYAQLATGWFLAAACDIAHAPSRVRCRALAASTARMTVQAGLLIRRMISARALKSTREGACAPLG